MGHWVGFELLVVRPCVTGSLQREGWEQDGMIGSQALALGLEKMGPDGGALGALLYSGTHGFA